MKKFYPLLLILLSCNNTETVVTTPIDTIRCCINDTAYSDTGEPLIASLLVTRYPTYNNTMIGDSMKTYRNLISGLTNQNIQIQKKFDAQLIVNGQLILDSVYQKKQIDTLRSFNIIQLNINRFLAADTSIKSKSISNLKDSITKLFVWTGNINKAGYKYRYSDSVDNVKTNIRLDSNRVLNDRDFEYDSVTNTIIIKRK